MTLWAEVIFYVLLGLSCIWWPLCDLCIICQAELAIIAKITEATVSVLECKRKLLFS